MSEDCHDSNNVNPVAEQTQPDCNKERPLAPGEIKLVTELEKIRAERAAQEEPCKDEKAPEPEQEADDEGPQQQGPQPIRQEEAAKVAHAIRRLRVLRQTTIHSPRSEAELNGLSAFVQNFLAAHADELVGCWFAVHSEYEPLCNAFATLLRRAGDANQIHAMRVQAAQKSAEKPAE